MYYGILFQIPGTPPKEKNLAQDAWLPLRPGGFGLGGKMTKCLFWPQKSAKSADSGPWLSGKVFSLLKQKSDRDSSQQIFWVVVANIFYFQPYLGKIPILTNIFQRGWNHQVVFFLKKYDSSLRRFVNHAQREAAIDCILGRRQTGWFSECDLWDLFSHSPKTQFLALILVWFQIISLEWSGMIASVQRIAFAMARITLVPMQHMPTEKKGDADCRETCLEGCQDPPTRRTWSIFNLAQQGV